MLLNLRQLCLLIAISILGFMCTIISCWKSKFPSTCTAMRMVTRRNLNRVLCEQEEVQRSTDGSLLLSLEKDDFRAKHINKILKLKQGDNIRGGIVDVGMTNVGTIEEAGDIVRINLGKKSDLYLTPKPSVDLILAIPRPRRLELLLPVISCLGVRNIFLIQARKVDKDYFGSHLLRTPAAMRTLLVEGLAQTEVDCRLPQVYIKRNLKDFLAKELDSLAPLGDNSRVITHPPLQNYHVGKPAFLSSADPSTTSVAEIEHLHSAFVKSDISLRFSEYLQHLQQYDDLSIQPEQSQLSVQRSQDNQSNSHSSGDNGSLDISNSRGEGEGSGRGSSRGMVIAVGPEGGWDEEEVRLFQQRGFQLVNLGPRILRTDIAVPVLLGLAHEHLSATQRTQIVK